MGKLLSVTSYVFDSAAFASASPMAIQSDDIKIVRNASTLDKKSNPAASTNINTVIQANYLSNNEGQDHILMVSETISTLVSNS